jgi:small subunit ribosomal protein S24e
MKVEIKERKRNELFKREEVKFQVNHISSGTPSLAEIRQRIADALNVDLEKVYVRKVETKRGTGIAVGEAKVYDTVEQARCVEPEYIILRNSPKKEAKER